MYKSLKKLSHVSSFVLLASLIFSVAHSEEKKSSETKDKVDSYVLCRNSGVVRTIRVAKNSEGCETMYTKSGVDSQVGQGKYIDSCRTILNNIRQNLEKSSWSCREVSNAGVSGEAPSPQ